MKIDDLYDMGYEADQEPGAKLSEPADFKFGEAMTGKEYYVTKRTDAMRVAMKVTRDARLVKLVVTAPNKKATQDEVADTFLHSLILRTPKPKEPAKKDGDGKPNADSKPAPDKKP
jgi:hypothetical protein